MDFSNLGVSRFPNPNFLAKNECPNARRNPIFIARLNNEDGSPHPLCPVHNLYKYLSVTANSNSCKLFVDPKDFSDLSIHRLRVFLCKFIRMANPGSFPKSHDLRKYATSFAFFHSMSIDELCNLVGWSSIRVFKRHYLQKISELSSSIVFMGSIIHGSKS